MPGWAGGVGEALDGGGVAGQYVVDSGGAGDSPADVAGFYSVVLEGIAEGEVFERVDAVQQAPAGVQPVEAVRAEGFSGRVRDGCFLEKLR
jgi:hypothetical protein